MVIRVSCYVFFLIVQLHVNVANAGEVRVAVASNFLSTLNEIAKSFEHDTGHDVTISSGSTGKLYAQIIHGAPFDVFFSADEARPTLMEKEGLAVNGSRFTYAIGRLTLWSADPTFIEGTGELVLSKGRFSHIAIANPKTAPYGAAAEQTLKGLGVWRHIKGRIVQGENIGQTFQFVFSGNAEIGLVALAQALDPRRHGAGSRWNVPVNLYDPLHQQAVLLVNGQDNDVAQAFLQYVQSPEARSIIERFGYGFD